MYIHVNIFKIYTYMCVSIYIHIINIHSTHAYIMQTKTFFWALVYIVSVLVYFTLLFDLIVCLCNFTLFVNINSLFHL